MNTFKKSGHIVDVVNKVLFDGTVEVADGRIVSIPIDKAASKTKFLPTDHPLIKVARDMGISFGD